MYRFLNDFELLMPVQRLFSESQCYTINVVIYGNVASLSPISVHSFERQLTKSTMLVVEETAVKSEMAIVRSLNTTVVHTVSMFFLMLAMLRLTSAMRCSTSAPDRQYGFVRLSVSLISFNMLATASPVASPAFSGSPLSSFQRSYLNF
jgi:hypothetical protein